MYAGSNYGQHEYGGQKLNDNFSQQITETVNTTDSFSYRKLFNIVIVESITIADNIFKNIYLFFAESITLTSSVIKTTIRYFSDSINLSDSIIKKLSKTLNDSIIILDKLQRTITRNIAESITLTSNVYRMKIYHLLNTESINLSVSIKKLIGKSLKEGISLFDRLYGLLNGVNMKYRKKYAEKTGTYTKKYSEKAANYIKKYFDV